MFKYYNRNPHNEKLPDCVCRAISLATDTDYHDIQRLLFENGGINECDELCVDCYSIILCEIGYKIYNGRGATVEEIAEHYPNSKLLLRLDGHLTCCINGNCYDIWDCTNESVDVYWVVE